MCCTSKYLQRKVKSITKLFEKYPQPCLNPPIVRMARWPKTPGELERRIGAESVRRDKIGKRVVVFVVCTAGAFIGCVDNVKSE